MHHYVNGRTAPLIVVDTNPELSEVSRSFCSYVIIIIIIIIIIVIIIIIIIIYCNWVVTRWQRLFYMYTNYEFDYY